MMVPTGPQRWHTVFVGGKRRNLGLVLLAAAIVVAVVLVLYAVGRSPEQLRNDLATYWGFALALGVPAATLITWLLRPRRKQDSGALGGRELDHLADQLAKAVKEQWGRAAGERGLLEPTPIPVHWRMPSEAMAGPVDAAVGSTRFSPLPGLCLIEPQDLEKGTISDLYAVYGGLGSGRLVIAGAPGSGKSGAAVLLILAALEHRRHVPKKARSQVPVPVPVMFTLQGWDPSQDVKKWLAERISETYPLFVGKDGIAAASDLLAEGRVAVILDGLDEIPRDLRPAVLRALSSQATFRLVLLTRSAEMAAAAGEVLLQGAAAIELQDIPDKTAASYLESVQLAPPPQGWSELVSHLRQKQPSPLKDALNNPLMLTLLRDTYHQEDDVSELLRLRSPAGQPASAQDITCHLLDRVLRAAYSQRPGEPPPRYDLPTASRTLGHIAVWMNKDGTRDLRWWQIPTWASVAPRVVITGLLAAVPTGILLSFTNNWLIGILPPLGIGLVVGTVAGAGNRVPKRINRLTWRQILQRKALKAGFRAGSRVGLVTGLLAALIIVLPNLGRLGPMWAVVYGLLATLLAGLVVTPIASLPLWLLTSASLPSIEDTSPLSPLTTWRRDRAFGRLAGVVIGLTILITLTFISWSTGPRNAVLSGLGLALIVGLPVWLTYPQAWPSSLAFAQLAISKNRTPVRLMRFLEDAHERGVLRTVGPVYQFRHASLQDRLAEQTSPLSWKPEHIHRQKSLVSEFDQLVDMLAISVQNRWLRVSKDQGLLKAEPIPVRWTKSSLPLAGPVSAAVHSTLFPPLPGLKAVAEQQLQAGQIVDLVQVFGGLRSGRLVIAGASGSGKTGAAVLLALMILIHREHVPDDDRPDVPVPVSFTLHGWDPRTQKVQDWLSLQLQQNYPLFIQKDGFAKAAELLGKGKIAVILDGLDEITEDLRPVALQELSRQAHFRMVILTRSAEMAAAATNGLLDGAAAIELQDIDHATAADYLARIQPNPVPKGWDDLVDHLRQTPDSSITQALNSPLALTLVRDSYRSSDDVSELLKISDATERQVPARDIVDYLLDRVLPAAYKQVPGDPAPRYKLQTSQMTLSRIAALMNQDSTYDLQWWRVKEWLPVTPRAVFTALIFGLVPAVLSGLANFMYWFTYVLGNQYGNTAEYRFLQQHGLQYWLLAYGFTVWLLYGLGAGLVVALPRMVSFLTPKKGLLGFYWLLREFPLDPSTARVELRHMRASAFGLELMMAFGAGMASLIPFGYVFLTAQEVALWVLAVFGVIMIVFGFLSALIGATLFTEAFNTLMASLAFAQLHLRWHTPIRLMLFLEDARRRGVLRKSGYVYQFRHARLQDRLAKQTSFSRK